MAKAQPGTTYAQIHDGRCLWIFTAADLPEWNDDDIQVVEVSGRPVKIGDLYDGLDFTAEKTSQPSLAVLCNQIDAAADAARRAVAGDPLRAVEYERSAVEAQAFKAGGYPANAVPRTVSAWAIGGRTAQQAADSILVESAAYTEALYQIREARLGAKEMVRQAMTAGEVDQAQDIAAETIAAIESAISGIGNARG